MFTAVPSTQFKLADNLAVGDPAYYYWGNGSGVGSSSYALNRGSNQAVCSTSVPAHCRPIQRRRHTQQRGVPPFTYANLSPGITNC